ncbi:YtpR family tRNA-binding protein, partial [Reinekea sp.]|uniref:YtpR family tRNA-binding protein n=1 Tax=Reinekea sp. TaxID=1970455 RepID=UPI00338FAD98
MKVSEKWLRSWVNPSVSAQELMDQVTMAGLEVEGFEPVAEAFSGVIVAEIISCERHPNADKLQVCTVSTGSENVQVVCGAPNARAGLKVGFAQVGAVLPGNLNIGQAKLRDVDSFGMLCSEQELGLSTAHEGILELPADAPVGQDIRTYYELDDIAIEVDLTPNRADCLSLRGLAREVGVLNDLPMYAPDLAAVPVQHQDLFDVTIEDGKGCPRYVGRVLHQVDISAATP